VKVLALIPLFLLAACGGASGGGDGPSEAEVTNQAKQLEKEAAETVNATIARINAEAEEANPKPTASKTEDE
jgi:hypothetical protein